ncbi:MAG: hypothetical protein AAF429_15630 [Pseudomonadota bacterium]
MMTDLDMTNFLILIAVGLHAVGYMVRDELRLRALVLSGTAIYLIYYFLVPGGPLWDAFLAASLIAIINIIMIAVLIWERTTIGMSDAAKRIFKSFGTLTPGQFRKLYAKASHNSADIARQLVKAEERQNRLFLVYQGTVEIGFGGDRHRQATPFFAGEIGFILEDIATADVFVGAGTKYLSWDYDDVRKMMGRNAKLENALIALFSKDLARKLGRSAPIKP